MGEQCRKRTRYENIVFVKVYIFRIYLFLQLKKQSYNQKKIKTSTDQSSIGHKNIFEKQKVFIIVCYISFPSKERKTLGRFCWQILFLFFWICSTKKHFKKHKNKALKKHFFCATNSKKVILFVRINVFQLFIACFYVQKTFKRQCYICIIMKNLKKKFKWNEIYTNNTVINNNYNTSNTFERKRKTELPLSKTDRKLVLDKIFSAKNLLKSDDDKSFYLYNENRVFSF